MRFAILALMLSIGISVLAAPVGTSPSSKVLWVFFNSPTLTIDSHAESVERGPIRYDPDVVMHRQYVPVSTPPQLTKHINQTPRHNNQRRKVKDSESVEVVQRSPKESTPRTTKQYVPVSTPLTKLSNHYTQT